MSTRQPAREAHLDEPSEDDSELMDQVGRLPRQDLAPLDAARIGADARHAFALAHRQAPPSPWKRLSVVYGHFVEPLLVAALCALYLRWALLAAMALQQ